MVQVTITFVNDYKRRLKTTKRRQKREKEMRDEREKKERERGRRGTYSYIIEYSLGYGCIHVCETRFLVIGEDWSRSVCFPPPPSSCLPMTISPISLYLPPSPPFPTINPPTDIRRKDYASTIIPYNPSSMLGPLNAFVQPLNYSL